MKKGALTITLLACASKTVLASGNQPVYEGCYEVQSGYVETLATNGVLRQQGTFSVSLKSSSVPRPKGVSEKLTIKLGVVVGEFAPSQDNPFNILHTLSNEDRNGFIVSDIGTLTSQVLVSSCVSEVTEVLEGFSGAGLYQGLDSVESQIIVEGELNSCNGQNTFDVTEGRLCF